MANNLNDLVLARIIAQKFDFDMITADAIARDLIRDDFPLNGITTIGQAIAYLNGLARMDQAAEQC